MTETHRAHLYKRSCIVVHLKGGVGQYVFELSEVGKDIEWVTKEDKSILRFKGTITESGIDRIPKQKDIYVEEKL